MLVLLVVICAFFVALNGGKVHKLVFVYRMGPFLCGFRSGQSPAVN